MARGGKRVKASLPDGVHTWSDGFSFKLDPTAEQLGGLARQAGARRFVFNWMLARINEQSRQWQAERDAGVPAADRVQPLEARASYEVFQAEAPTWWADARVSMWVYRKAIDDAVKAHRRFLAGLSRYPRFAKKGVSAERCSFQGADVVLTEAGTVRLPQLGWVRIAGCPSRLAEIRRLLRRGRAKLLRVTVSRHADGLWWVSGSLERQARVQPQHPAHQAPVVGADRGLKTACVAATADGTEVVSLPAGRRYRDAQRALRRAQRAMSRRYQKGVKVEDQSANYHKAKRVAGRLHEQIGHQRANDLHCYTKQLVAASGVVVLEDLHIAGLVRNKHLAKAFADQALGELGRQITYKMERRGGQVIVADRWFPSSKRCSTCGAVKPKLRLAERTYHCEQCGLVIDRDLNAAVNLAVWGETALAHHGLEPNAITRLVLAIAPTSGTGTHPAGQDPVSTPEGGDGSAASAVVVPGDPGTRQLAHAS